MSKFDPSRMSVDLCQDCQYYLLKMCWCMRPVGERWSFVKGWQKTSLASSAERERAEPTWFGRQDRCGPFAKYFERKPPMEPPKRGSGVRHPPKVPGIKT